MLIAYHQSRRQRTSRPPGKDAPCALPLLVVESLVGGSSLVVDDPVSVSVSVPLPAPAVVPVDVVVAVDDEEDGGLLAAPVEDWASVALSESEEEEDESSESEDDDEEESVA